MNFSKMLSRLVQGSHVVFVSLINTGQCFCEHIFFITFATGNTGRVKSPCVTRHPEEEDLFSLFLSLFSASSDKVVTLVKGGSVMNGATTSSFTPHHVQRSRKEVLGNKTRVIEILSDKFTRATKKH